MLKKRMVLSITCGYRTALTDGCLVGESPFHMATELFYPVSKGDFIECVDKRYIFAVATFEAKLEDKYLYTYDYKRDSAWVVYRRDLTPESYSRNTFVFKEDGYCRICVKRADGSEVDQADADRINDILHFYVTEQTFEAKECFVQEIAETVEKAKEKTGSLKLCLLTDSHYTVNGTWQDTADNIHKTIKELDIDAIVHLGDFTDGMTSKAVTSL